MAFYENNQNPERAVLLGVDTGEYDCEVSLAELEELSKTAKGRKILRPRRDGENHRHRGEKHQNC